MPVLFSLLADIAGDLISIDSIQIGSFVLLLGAHDFYFLCRSTPIDLGFITESLILQRQFHRALWIYRHQATKGAWIDVRISTGGRLVSTACGRKSLADIVGYFIPTDCND